MPLNHAHFSANLALKWMLIHKISRKIDFLPGLCGTTPTCLKRWGGGGGGATAPPPLLMPVSKPKCILICANLYNAGTYTYVLQFFFLLSVHSSLLHTK